MLIEAIINQPSLLLADEPTGALDSATSQEIMQFLQQLNDEGKTILIVTHEEDISLMCKRIVRLKDGVIMEDKKIKTIVDHIGRTVVGKVTAETKNSLTLFNPVIIHGGGPMINTTLENDALAREKRKGKK